MEHACSARTFSTPSVLGRGRWRSLCTRDLLKLDGHGRGHSAGRIPGVFRRLDRNSQQGPQPTPLARVLRETCMDIRQLRDQWISGYIDHLLDSPSIFSLWGMMVD
jgi:hypothetical protein